VNGINGAGKNALDNVVILADAEVHKSQSCATDLGWALSGW
jgi:hypothetical protein